MEGLSTYYNLSECIERDLIFEQLNKLAEQNKIEWNVEDIDTIKIVDIDLDETEIEDTLDFFYKYDVISDVYRSAEDEYYNSRDIYPDDDYNDYDDFGFGDDVN